jgi:hypothetical protein
MVVSGHISRDPKVRDEVHRRWVARQNRDTADPSYHDEWYDEQCGGCWFWIPLAGELGSDYGACANASSPFDSTVRFEHDGCDVFEDAGGWITPADVQAPAK